MKFVQYVVLILCEKSNYTGVANASSKAAAIQAVEDMMTVRDQKEIVKRLIIATDHMEEVK
jgi:hypothetical protein